MKQITVFLKEVKSELQRVQWPSRSEFIGATIITLILVLFFTVYFAVVDQANRWIIYDKIFSRVKK